MQDARHERRPHRSLPFRAQHVGLFVGALAVTALAAGAALVALGGGSPGNGAVVAPSITAPATARPTARPSTSPAGPGPSASGSVPIPSVAASPRLAGIVADRIQVARLDIDLRVVEGDGVDAPMNRAAHYPGTGWPDGGTNIYLYAHARPGMFLTLWDAIAGDAIDLHLVDGTSRRYVVTEVKPRVPWNALEYVEPTPTEQLTLQTSTSYTATAPRFIVIAKPLP